MADTVIYVGDTVVGYDKTRGRMEFKVKRIIQIDSMIFFELEGYEGLYNSRLFVKESLVH